MVSEAPGPPPTRTRLDSWKEIAAHLQRDVRTVQRWEKLEGLPVYRHMHGERGTVYAYADELNQWWARRQPEAIVAAPAARRSWWPFAAVAGFGILAAAAWFAIPKRTAPVPAPKRIGRLLAAVTSEGRQPVIVPLPAPSSFVILTPDEREAYIIHSSANFVSVLDTRTNRITRRVEVGPGPSRAVMSPDGSRLYIGSAVSDLTVIETATKKVRIIPIGGPVTDVAVTPDGRKVFLASEYSGLKRLLTATGELATLPGTVCPMYLAMNPSGTRLYVSYQCGGPGGRSGHDAIDVVDVATEHSVATFQGPPLVGRGISVTPDGQHLWAGGGDACASPQYDHQGCPFTPADVFHVIRTQDLSLVQTLGFQSTSPGASFATLYPDGSRAVLTGVGVRVVDAVRFTILERLGPLPEPFLYGQIALTRDGRRAYLPSPKPGQLAVIDLSPSGCEPPAAGLHGFWPGDGSTDDAHDGGTAELKNGAGYAPGRVGQAFRLDGVNDFVRIRSIGGPITRTEGTIGAWVKAGNLGRTMYIADRSQAGGEFGWRLYVEPPGRFTFCLAGATGCVSSTTIAEAGQWYHLAGTRTESKLMLYVNGVGEASKPLSKLPPENVNDNPVLHLGASQTPGAYFDGLIDEVVLYRRALNAADIGQLFEAGRCLAGGN